MLNGSCINLTMKSRITGKWRSKPDIHKPFPALKPIVPMQILHFEAKILLPDLITKTFVLMQTLHKRICGMDYNPLHSTCSDWSLNYILLPELWALSSVAVPQQWSMSLHCWISHEGNLSFGHVLTTTASRCITMLSVQHCAAQNTYVFKEAPEMLLGLFSYCSADQRTTLVPQAFHFACNHWSRASNLFWEGRIICLAGAACVTKNVTLCEWSVSIHRIIKPDGKFGVPTGWVFSSLLLFWNSAVFQVVEEGLSYRFKYFDLEKPGILLLPSLC